MSFRYQLSFTCAPLCNQRDHVKDMLAKFYRALDDDAHLRKSYLRIFTKTVEQASDPASDFNTSFDNFLSHHLPTIKAASENDAGQDERTMAISEGLLQAFQRSSEAGSTHISMCAPLGLILASALAHGLANAYEAYLSLGDTPSLQSSGDEVEMGRSGQKQQEDFLGGVLMVVFDSAQDGQWIRLKRLEVKARDTGTCFQLSQSSINQYMMNLIHSSSTLSSLESAPTTLTPSEIRHEATSRALLQQPPSRFAPSPYPAAQDTSMMNEVRISIGQHHRGRPTHTPEGARIKY